MKSKNFYKKDEIIYKFCPLEKFISALIKHKIKTYNKAITKKIEEADEWKDSNDNTKKKVKLFVKDKTCEVAQNNIWENNF